MKMPITFIWIEDQKVRVFDGKSIGVVNLEAGEFVSGTDKKLSKSISGQINEFIEANNNSKSKRAPSWQLVKNIQLLTKEIAEERASLSEVEFESIKKAFWALQRARG